MTDLIERLRDASLEDTAIHEGYTHILHEAADALEARAADEVDGYVIAEVVAYLNGHKTDTAKRMADAVLRLLNRHYQDAAALEAAREDAKAVGTVLGGEFHYLRPSHGLPDGTMLYAIDQARGKAGQEVGDG